ncbi:MAG: HEAT repeat domain-containing protein, partial [Gemmatimonadaceae bacterium]
WIEVTQIFGRLLDHEEKLTDPDQRRAWLIHVRRLCTSGTLRAIGLLIARQRDMRDAGHRVLGWSGDLGADVLLDLLTNSEHSGDRRAYRTAILSCPASVTPLMHMLDDDRWFVVRNAVELLGELKATESDAKVAAALKHSDARVRRSAATSLAKLATARAIPALLPLLNDSSATVRLATVHGLSQLKSPRAVAALLPALDRESDVEVQQAIFGALASHPTDAAVERLAQAAQPGSILNRRSASMRLPAVHALAEAGTAAAFSALRTLTTDRDREVRSAAERLLGARAASIANPR